MWFWLVAGLNCLFAALGVQVLDEFKAELLSQGGELLKILLILLLVLDLRLDTCGGEC